jgi:excisionase family DNA binding protein
MGPGYTYLAGAFSRPTRPRTSGAVGGSGDLVTIMDQLVVAALERLAVAAERQAVAVEKVALALDNITRSPQLSVLACSGSSESQPLAKEVSTAEAAKILGVSKDTVLRLQTAGELPFRNAAPPGGRPVFRFPLDDVLKLRHGYQTEERRLDPQQDLPRRTARGKKKYKHLQLDEGA